MSKDERISFLSVSGTSNNRDRVDLRQQLGPRQRDHEKGQG